MNRWTVSNKAVYNIGYHIIFCPKYRKPVLVEAVETRLKELLTEKALELEVDIKEMAIMPDHVHLFVKTKPNESPHTVVGQLKGYTSRTLRKEFRELRKLPSLWTRSYFAESVGCLSEEAVRKYIENQKNV